MKKFILPLISVAFLVSCANTAKHYEKEVQNADASKIYPDLKTALKELKAEYTVHDKEVSIEFTKEDKLIDIEHRNAPIKRLSLDLDKARFLKVSAVNKQNIDGKVIGVQPWMKIIKGDQEFAAPLKKTAWRGICGMHACSEKTYDLSKLPKGQYDLIVTAYVDNPDKPNGYLKDSMGRKADMYPNYYGEVRFALLEKLD